ncbi:hypothetical protein ACSW8Q_17565 (plasmid) [Clostridium perfringens]
MPFDFVANKKYKINYDSLFEEFNSQKILNNKVIQEKFLMLWFKYLREADELLLKSIEEKENKIKLKKLRISDVEIFKQTIHYKNNIISMHFNVSKINSNISNEFKNSFQIFDGKKFLENDRNVHWTDVVLDKNYKPSNEPVLVVEFPCFNRRYLVIDGNHRISYAIKNNKTVKVLGLSVINLIDNEYFLSSFDMLYYIMINELNYMYNETISKNIDATYIIQKSFLNIFESKLKSKKNIFF